MTDNTSEDIHALAGPYALDALTGDERSLFERHLPNCAVCSVEVAELGDATVKLTAGIAVAPPRSMKDAVMAAIAQVEQLPPTIDNAESALGTPVALHTSRPKFGRRSVFALAAALVIIAGVGGIAVDQYRQNSATQRASEQIAAVLAEPDSRTFHGSLAGGGQATMIASSGKDSAVVVLSDLPALPSKKTYQLWLIDKTKTAHSIGLAKATSSNQTKLIASGISGKVAFGVTVEPDGGSEQPTMPAVVTIPMAA